MKRVVLVSALLLAIGTPARSQFTQYVPSNTRFELPEEAAEEAEKAAEDARWRLGGLRIEPHLTLSNVGYFENVFSAPDGTTQVNDSRATVGAGLAGYLRLGGKSMLAAFLAPEYFWWQEAEDLRELGLNSGLAWFGSFNRLRVSADARSTERERALSAELEAPVQILADTLKLDMTLEVTRRLAVFGLASDSKTRHGKETEQFVPGLDLETLDRDQTRRGLGLELRGSDFKFGIGFEQTDVDFISSDNRDNTGEGPSLYLSYDRHRLNAHLTYADLEFEYEDPALPSNRQAIATGLVLFRLRPETTAGLYVAEGLAFTSVSSTGIIESDNLGLSLQQDLGRRLEASAFIETGTQTFVDAENPGRVDDLETVGLRFRFEVNESFALTGQLSEETWDSTFPEFDRSSSGLSLGIDFGRDLLPW